MAVDGIVFPLVTSLLKKLGSAIEEEMRLIHGVHKELKKLQRAFCVIKKVLLDAEEKSNHNNAVKDWLEELKDATYDVDEILDSFSYESMSRNVMTEGKKAKKVRIFLSKHNHIVFRLVMAHKIKNLSERLDHIANERAKFHLEETVDNIAENGRRETHSFVPEDDVIGRDEEKEEVVERLLEINEQQNVSVDAIVGLGGMGKTTLAQSVFNHKRVKDAFQLRLWVCVSQRFDLKAILEKIIESATNERPSVQELDTLQKKLRNEIDGKKYLLVIDDLWNDDGNNWDDLKRLLMGGAKGSKILITTRAEGVAEISQATSSYNIKGLSKSKSWLLFKKMAFKDGEEPKSPNMIQIGKEIANECFGSPLVIRTIGRLLYFKTSAEWLSFKKSDLETITRQENRIFQVLKLSYNHLPPHLKPCFAYCALFPEDHWFKKDELIKLWVAEGFVQSRGENKCLEDVGDDYFMELAWRSFFQDVEKNEHGDIVRCKMHDLMHDLARLVAGTECYTTNSDIENVNGRTRRISHNCYRVNWSLCSTPELKPYKLRTFLSPNGYSWERDESKLNADITSLRSLRVLALKCLSMKEVLFSIGMLKHLRYLDLSGNDEIKSLPSSITKLHNLQTLNISFSSSLTELPRDIGNLTNLRHLYLSYNMSVERLPTSVTKLKFLQTLILSGTHLKKLPENIGNMLDLRILDLENNSSIKLLPNSIVKLKKLQWLNLKNCGSLVELPSDVSNLIDLKHLDLADCDRLRSMPIGLNKLTALQTLNLFAVGASVSSEDGGSWQLNTLINLRGTLRIRGLHHLRKDASQSNTVNLKDVHGVRDLSLEWKEASEIPAGIDDPDFVVLEKLHPNKNVETLRMDGYGGVRLPSWVSSLSNMIHLSLQNCERLLNVPRLDRLPKLQKLELCNINSIEYMDNNEAGDGFGLSVFFPSLRSLTLENMDKLKGWWNPKEFSPKDPGQSFSLPSFHCLVDLNIESCPQLLSIPSPNSSLKTMSLRNSNVELFKGEVFVSASPEDDTQQREVLDGRDDLRSECLQHLTSLQSLSIIDCNDLIAVPAWIGNIASLQKLEIRNCPNLTSFPDGIVNLFSLQELKIETCPKLTLPLPDGIVRHSSLQKLKIIDCSKLDWIDNFISLQELIINGCPRLASLPNVIVNLTSLRKLDVRDCRDLTSLPDEIGNLTSLHELIIETCPKLTPLPDGIVSHSSLKKLEVIDCPELDWIGNLISLQELRIMNCERLASLPNEIVNLTSLRKLDVIYCIDLTSLPDGIGNLTSLQELKIGSCHNLTSLPERMGNLALLQKLVIENCLEITSLRDGIPKLTSLQLLKIRNCPKLAWLPENKEQPSSTRRLTRSGCGRRQEERRTQQIGENWSEMAPGEFIRISESSSLQLTSGN